MTTLLTGGGKQVLPCMDTRKSLCHAQKKLEGYSSVKLPSRVLRGQAAGIPSPGRVRWVSSIFGLGQLL